MKAKQYALCTAKSPDLLNREVSDYLVQGWELYGSPMILETPKFQNGEVVFICGQAVIFPVDSN